MMFFKVLLHPIKISPDEVGVFLAGVMIYRKFAVNFFSASGARTALALGAL